MELGQYLFQIRQTKDEPLSEDMLLASGKLFQQYALDFYCCMEGNRLEYYAKNQTDMKAEKYKVLRDAVDGGEGEKAGKYVVLPSTHIGSPRWYKEKYHDAMSRAEALGVPDLFITFTCNPKWEEFSEVLRDAHIKNNVPLTDRPDIVARVFEVKLRALLADLTEKKVFGEISGYQAIVEWQKRGLPHAHILIFLIPSDRPKSCEAYDRYCCGEIPDRETNPKLWELVTTHMIHGPCGTLNPTNVCMKNGKCMKGFPKAFCEQTVQLENSYPELRRRRPAKHDFHTEIKRNGVTYTVDNSWVVPYNPYLLMKYQAHINVEIVNSIGVIKYLHKYIYKGGSKAVLSQIRVAKQTTSSEVVIDEIKNYSESRYIGAAEAFQRIYSLTLDDSAPSVIRLSYHEPENQTIVYQKGTQEDSIKRNEKTQLTTFFEAVLKEKQNPIPNLPQGIPPATELTYTQFPKYFVYEHNETQNIHGWKRRYRNGESRMITRLYWTSPTQENLYYLSLLLPKVEGPTSFSDLMTFNGHVYMTFRDACVARGIVTDEEEWKYVSEKLHKFKQI
jgi:hypothetical protein